MAMKTTNTVPITGYVTPVTKERLERIYARDRHMKISRIVDEAVTKYLPELEASFQEPTQEARSGKAKRNTTA